MDAFHKKEFFQTAIKHWFQEEKRSFPWRLNPTPYTVWVSEIMLQQTLAAVVIPYFERWMRRFPTIESLAAAPLEEVIKLWEGLGYYSRARFLHEAAQEIVSIHRSKIPNTLEGLKKIKGIGSYTAGAILNFAFHQKASAVDGNVARVVARLFCIEEEISPKVLQSITKIVEEILPDSESWIIMEGLIELGALVCKKAPECTQCPLQDGCLAFQRGKAEIIPPKKKRPKITHLKRFVFLIEHQDNFLIQKVEGKKVMSGLYEFPYLSDNVFYYPEQLQFIKTLNPVSHSFTRYRAELFPSLWRAENKCDLKGYIWADRKELKNLPFSSGHRKILEIYENSTH